MTQQEIADELGVRTGYNRQKYSEIPKLEYGIKRVKETESEAGSTIDRR